MADWDVTNNTQAADPWGVAAHEPHTPAAPSGAMVSQPTQTAELPAKLGIGTLGVGAATAAALALRHPEMRTMIEEALARASNANHETPLAQRAGLRTAQDAPVARTLAGASGQEALRLHNAEVSRTIAANEAGIPGAQEPVLSADILADARRDPGSVYDRLAAALPPGNFAGTDAERAIQAVGPESSGRITRGTPEAQAQIADLKAQLLDPKRMFSGQQYINEMRGLRQEGFTNLASDDVSNQQIGRAQLQFARAIEDHVESNIPADSGVTAEQFRDARKTLAKNFTIQAALRGGDVDLKALARAQRADPQVLDGGTKLLADFGDMHPEVAGLPTESTRYNPPSVSRDVADISFKNPASWIRPALGELARRSLVGDPDAAVAAANQQFPARDAGAFSAPPNAPPPKFGGYLPAPAAVNAGGGASTENTLRELGLTPDVQAAGALHPARARLQALREQLAQTPERPAESVDFQGPQNWGGGLSLAPQQETTTPAASGGLPLASVLEQGGTQRAPVGAPGVAYRPPSISPNQNRMRTPDGALELTEFTPNVPSDAQMNFRNQQAAARLRKVAGDLRLEGPGGSTGDPIERLRAALERRERGYAEGGEVRSSSPGSPGVGGAVKDALAALRNYLVTVPQRRLQSEREGLENQVVDDTVAHPAVASPSENYAEGGEVINLMERLARLGDRAKAAAPEISASTPANFADAQSKRALSGFASQLQDSVKARAAQQQGMVESLGHQYSPGDVVAGDKGNYRVLSKAATKNMPDDVARLTAGESLKGLNQERAQRPWQPAYFVESAQGDRFTMPEWGIKHNFQGPVSVPDTPPENYADGGGVPSIAQQEAIEQATRQLADLVSTHENTAQTAAQPRTEGYAGGGRIELMGKIGEYLDKLAQERAARNAALGDRAPKLPLQQLPEDPVAAAAAAPPPVPYNPLPPAQAPQNPLQPGFLTKQQGMADGGTVESDSSIRKLADAARRLNPSAGSQAAEDRARLATNLASLVYGLDAQGRPALGGRAWTPSQGGTPAGILDAISAVPHGLAQAGATLTGLPRRLLEEAWGAQDKSPIQVFDPKTLDAIEQYLPGKDTQSWWNSIDPPASRAAAQRLSQLKQRMQQAAGVAPAKSLEDVGLDTVSDPSMVAPLGIAKVANEGSALRHILNWGAGSTGEAAAGGN